MCGSMPDPRVEPRRSERQAGSLPETFAKTDEVERWGQGRIDIGKYRLSGGCERGGCRCKAEAATYPEDETVGTSHGSRERMNGLRTPIEDGQLGPYS